MSKPKDILQFKDDISDKDLPLEPILQNTRVSAFLKDKVKLKRFDEWSLIERDSFHYWQKRFNVPLLDLADGSIARHYDFDELTTLPWLEPEMGSSTDSPSLPQDYYGGFGTVSIIGIDPKCHKFYPVFKELELKTETFALKVLNKKDFANDEKRYQHEVEQLKRFNGKANPHLVTLLASYTFGRNNYSFLFPCADCTLEDFWRKNEPERNAESIKWISSQLLGIIRAVEVIHEPKHLHAREDEKRYGRHGDIKPDNILCYGVKGSSHKRLVVTDLGLSSIHRYDSRTYKPEEGKRIPPNYRPPECDEKIDKGEVSRNFDIWTLGCLFMEQLVWLLGGDGWLQEFQQDRTTRHILGFRDIFYNICAKEDYQGQFPENGKVVFQLKPEVVRWFGKIYDHEQCSEFIHDVCKTIENDMLLVIDRKDNRPTDGTGNRTQIDELAKKFEAFSTRCLNDEEYCLEKHQKKETPLMKRGAEWELSKKARDQIRENKTRLPVMIPVNHDPW
ncbi:kinase-like domain-containing protein [Biscogniauxia marginata]|nr:kinase-like domain-containing protein [Biscogniauxia marginata]